MIELFGPIPASLRNTGELSSKYFDQDGKSFEPKPNRVLAYRCAGNLLNIKHMYPFSLSELLKKSPNTSMSSSDYARFERF